MEALQHLVLEDLVELGYDESSTKPWFYFIVFVSLLHILLFGSFALVI